MHTMIPTVNITQDDMPNGYYEYEVTTSPQVATSILSIRLLKNPNNTYEETYKLWTISLGSSDGLTHKIRVTPNSDDVLTTSGGFQTYYNIEADSTNYSGPWTGVLINYTA